MCRCNQPDRTCGTEARTPIDRAEFACLMQACICRVAATLPPLTAELFRRVDGEGQPPGTVAAALGLSQQQAGAQLRLARQRLLHSLVGPAPRKPGPGSG